MPAMRTLLALLLAAALSLPAGADDLSTVLVGRVDKPLIDPAGFFAVVLPAGFDCQAEQRRVRCNGNRGVQSSLTIDVIDVPASATVELLMLNQMDEFKKKEHFKLLNKKVFKIDGTKALLSSFTYDYLGNVQLAGFAQAVYMVKVNKAYVIHYEGRADQVAVHKKDLDDLYASFKAARLDGGGHPIVEDLKPKQKQGTGNADLDRALRGGF